MSFFPYPRQGIYIYFIEGYELYKPFQLEVIKEGYSLQNSWKKSCKQKHQKLLSHGPSTLNINKNNH